MKVHLRSHTCFDLGVGQFGQKRFLRYSFWRANGAANVGGSNATLRNKTLTFHISIYSRFWFYLLHSFIVAHTSNGRRRCKCPKVRTGMKQYQKDSKSIYQSWYIDVNCIYTCLNSLTWHCLNFRMCKSHQKPSDLRAKEVTCRQLGQRVCRQASNVGSRVPKHHVSTCSYKMLFGAENKGFEDSCWYISTLKPEAFCGILIISDIPHCTMIKPSFLNQTELRLRVLFFILSKQKLPRFVDSSGEDPYRDDSLLVGILPTALHRLVGRIPSTCKCDCLVWL